MTLREESVCVEGKLVWVRVWQPELDCARCLIELRADGDGETCHIDVESFAEATRLLPAAVIAFAASTERRVRERHAVARIRC